MNTENLFKALSNETRLRILNLLVRSEICVSEFEEILELPQVNISRQLKELRDEEIVKTRRDKNKIYYSMSEQVMLIDGFTCVLVSLTKNNDLLQSDIKKLEAMHEEAKGYRCLNCEERAKIRNNA